MGLFVFLCVLAVIIASNQEERAFSIMLIDLRTCYYNIFSSHFHQQALLRGIKVIILPKISEIQLNFFFLHIRALVCQCVFWFSDCSSCYQLETGAFIGIITCDIILTLLIALSVYCFVSRQKRRESLHVQPRCCGSGMRLLEKSKENHGNEFQSKWHIFLMFKAKQKLTSLQWGQRQLKWNHLIR